MNTESSLLSTSAVQIISLNSEIYFCSSSPNGTPFLNILKFLESDGIAERMNRTIQEKKKRCAGRILSGQPSIQSVGSKILQGLQH